MPASSSMMLVALSALAAMVNLALAATPAGEKPGGKATAKLSELQRAVAQYCEKQLDLLPTDLITRDDVAPLLAQLRRKKLISVDVKQVLAKVPSPDEFLVRQLRTPNGEKFMQRIASLPRAYDRLDRLSRLPLGQQTVRDLIRGPGGDELIQYMTTTPGGKALGRQLSNAPDGKDFNAPTGRIYTMAMLLDYLERAAAKPKLAEKQSR